MVEDTVAKKLKDREELAAKEASEPLRTPRALKDWLIIDQARIFNSELMY